MPLPLLPRWYLELLAAQHQQMDARMRARGAIASGGSGSSGSSAAGAGAGGGALGVPPRLRSATGEGAGALWWATGYELPGAPRIGGGGRGGSDRDVLRSATRVARSMVGARHVAGAPGADASPRAGTAWDATAGSRPR